MTRVLLIEDDQEIARLIKYFLGMKEIYEVDAVDSVAEALRAARDCYDIILLDIMLPDGNGIELCGKLRQWHSCPIIFITCLDDNATIISALECGGDDYIVKPFDNEVLHAHIQANLRRGKMREVRVENRLECRGFYLDANTHEVVKNNNRITLTPTEYKLLAYMMQNPGVSYRSSELYKLVWGKPSYGDNRTVNVYIHSLRQKVEDDPSAPKYIVSIWGKGYTFAPEAQD